MSSDSQRRDASSGKKQTYRPEIYDGYVDSTGLRITPMVFDKARQIHCSCYERGRQTHELAPVEQKGLMKHLETSGHSYSAVVDCKRSFSRAYELVLLTMLLLICLSLSLSSLRDVLADRLYLFVLVAS